MLIDCRGHHCRTETEEAALKATEANEKDSPGSFMDSSGKSVRFFADSPAAAANAANLIGVKKSRSRFTKAELNGLTDELKAAAGQTAVSFQFYYDAASDSIKVEGNLAAASLSGNAVSQGKVKFLGGDVRRMSRSSDIAPHWGGAGINGPTGSCSSAFTVKTAAGATRAVTAAHCGSLNSSWASGVNFFGKMTSRGPFPAWDLALLSGSTYDGRIYMGGSAGTGTSVASAASPVVGGSHCSSGASTFETCGKVVNSLSGSVCDVSGCTNNLAAMQGGVVIRDGDSGGPLVVKSGGKVLVRGVMIASGSITQMAQTWGQVASHFGVSIVTS